MARLWERLPSRVQGWGLSVSEYGWYAKLLLCAAWKPTEHRLRDLWSEAFLFVVGVGVFVLLLLRTGSKGKTVDQLGPSLLWTGIVLAAAVVLMFLLNLARAPARVYWAERKRAADAEELAESRTQEFVAIRDQLIARNILIERLEANTEGLSAEVAELHAAKRRLEDQLDDRELRALEREGLTECLHEANELRVALDQAIATHGERSVQAIAVCQNMDDWGKSTEEYLEAVVPHLVALWRTEPTAPLIPFDDAKSWDVGWHRNWIAVRIERLESFVRNYL